MGVQNTAPSVFSYSTFIFICYKCMEVGNLAYISHFFLSSREKNLIVPTLRSMTVDNEDYM